MGVIVVTAVVVVVVVVVGERGGGGGGEGGGRKKKGLFVRLVGFLASSSTTRLDRGRAPRQPLTISRAATHETALGNHDFLSQPVRKKGENKNKKRHGEELYQGTVT